MIDAAIKALTQMFSPSFRTILLKSIGLALLIVLLLGIALHRLLAWLAEAGGVWTENAVGTGAHVPVIAFTWLISIAAGLGIVLGAVFLMPAVTAFVGSFFVDEVADEVEHAYYPAEPEGRAVPVGIAVIEGIKTALLAILVYIVALPFLLFAGLGLVILFLAASYLLGREYFELAAMRFRPAAEAKAFRKFHRGTVFFAGMLIALFVSIPILNLATPLFAMALMVHMHKRLSGGRIELLDSSPVMPR
jgi:uncharacterized protein involved in cysteine biosynthesis